MQPRLRSLIVLTAAGALLAGLRFARPAATATPRGNPPPAAAGSSPIDAAPAGSSALPATDWLGEREPDLPSDRADWVRRGMAWAQARRETMLRRMRDDPADALALALSLADYHRLPPEVRGLVEEPFSERGDLDVTPVRCPPDPDRPAAAIPPPNGDELRYTFWPTGGPPQLAQVVGARRAQLSQTATAAQGIRLDGRVIVRETFFQPLENRDLAVAERLYPWGQPDPARSAATGQPLDGGGVVALAGGQRFAFADAAELAAIEERLQATGRRPGRDRIARVLFARGADGDPLFAALAEEEAAAASYPPTTGAKTALFIRVDFSDVPGSPIDAASLAGVVNTTVAQNLSAFSYARTGMTATVYPAVLRMPSVSTAYVSGPKDSDTLWNEAVAAYVAAGNPSPTAVFDTVAVYFADIGYTWAGLATIGGQRLWLNGSSNAGVITHELGHNYGLMHASSWDVTSSNPVDPAGASTEYGDSFDVMGSSGSGGHFHTAAKQFLGWLDAVDWTDITNAAQNATYRLYRFDTATPATGRKALRIAKSATSDQYWVSFRRQFNQRNFLRGAYVNWEKSAAGGGTPTRNRGWLLDMTPGSADGKNDAGLALGRTYSDTGSNVHLTPIATGGTAPGEWLDVRVNLGPFPGNVAPTGSLSAPATAIARQPALLSVAATDANGDALAYAWDLGDGEVMDNTNAVMKTWMLGGAYTNRVTVSDMKGGACALTNIVTVSDPLDTWTARASGTTNSLTGIAANSTRAVVMGRRSRVLHSTNGITWTATSSLGANVYLHDVVWTGARFVAAGEDYDSGAGAWEGVVYTSSDGLTWTRKYETNAAGSTIWGTAFNAVAVSGDGQTLIAAGHDGAAARSTNGGVAWSALATLGVTAGTSVHDIAWGNGAFLIGGGNTGGSGGFFAKTSADHGATWTSVSAALGLDASAWQDIRDVEHLGDRFALGGWYAGLRTTTNNGVAFASLGSRRYTLAGFARHGPLYFATGTDGDRGLDVDLVSLDGVNWTEKSVGPLDERNEVAAFKNTLITVGDNGTIRQSAAVLSGYDLWAFDRWPAWGASALEGADPDGDTAINLAEYALGSNPTDAGSVPPDPAPWMSAGLPGLSFSRPSRPADVRVDVERSDDLATWTTDGVDLVTDSATLLQARGALTPGQNRLFFRLRIRRP